MKQTSLLIATEANSEQSVSRAFGAAVTRSRPKLPSVPNLLFSASHGLAPQILMFETAGSKLASLGPVTRSLSRRGTYEKSRNII
jgi:hypothetical protein